MARVRPGQAPPDPWLLAGGCAEAPRSRVAAGHLRSKRGAPLTVEGHARMLSGPSPVRHVSAPPWFRPSPLATWVSVDSTTPPYGIGTSRAAWLNGFVD